jgi:hypothetical protein
MSNSVSRRKFIQTTGVAAVAGLTSKSVFGGSEKILIIGVYAVRAKEKPQQRRQRPPWMLPEG